MPSNQNTQSWKPRVSKARPGNPDEYRAELGYGEGAVGYLLLKIFAIRFNKASAYLTIIE